ncbi:hypothetical protein F5B22DRAFT_644751 [Xylaria bambusicola]|uniref:uncharacterized protein n=1 Tax=Xylaria bambusicola TaxID=326684 RepID=UPI0020074BB6|nr:uncharacterized protein F5B22DRAFT_644751 [Xylaria bambusicola]KAI0518445.1 hypothetical protein F5B22DRAFT_644751 [Xylaria bambusicola]
MPSSESFMFPEEDQMTDMFSSCEFNSAFHFNEAANVNSPMKDVGIMDFQGGDGDGSTMYGGSGYTFPQHPGQVIPTTNKPKSQLPSHRGSTSSSSSLRSTDSGSPQTSVHATPIKTSPGEWPEDIGGNEDDLSMDSSIDMSQFLTLSGETSSPTPPVPNELSPESHTSTEPLSQGRAVKRRRARSKRRTGQVSSRLPSKVTSQGLSELSPVSAYIPSTESSPGTVYTNMPSPDGNFNNFGDTLGGMNMPANWTPIVNGQIGNQLFPVSTSDSTYIPQVNHYNPPNSNTPAPISHSLLPRLVIHPMPAKSRVETQIPLKITLHNLPKGIKRVHLPTHTIAKPKLLQKPPTGPSPDMLELTTMLVCTSAMTDEGKQKRAFTRAAGKSNSNEPNNSIDGSEDEENKPQNGGEVRICNGCITRERKRAGRKKHKKPEEEELWDRYERERAIVFNTLEVKEWQTVTAVMADPTGAGLREAIREGTVQVDAPMRIACYCRHHGEKLGFQVIITLKDYNGNVVAQGMSSSIMITDDHKTPTHTGPTTTTQLEQSPQPLTANASPTSLQSGAPQPPTTQPTSMAPSGAQTLVPFQSHSDDVSALPFRQNHSTSDLRTHEQGCSLDMSFGPHGSSSQLTSTTATPHNLSRQTSPASPLSTSSRKRKASMVGKVPAGLAMTKIEPSQPSPPMAHSIQNESAVISAGTSPFSAAMAHTPLHGDLSNPSQQHILNTVSHQSLGAGPVTPNNNGPEPFVFTGMNNRVMNIERPVHQLFSAPVSAHPSRAPSPSQLRPEGMHHSQISQDMLPVPIAPPPSILRIIPNEGSKSGGAEITVLGSNFTNDGLEVYFGQNRAITTTFWGPTSLVCMLPPSPVPGPVPVSIKQPGRRPVPQSALFTYKDDEENELIRTALSILAGQYGTMGADPIGIARRILFSQTSASGSNNQSLHGNGNNPFTHLRLESGEAVETSLLRVLEVLDLDESADTARINLRGPSGQTMLHLACSLGFIRFVAGLLSRGARVDVRDKGGFTPLHMAAMNDRPEIVRRLIAKGADRNLQSRSGLTPMDVAGSTAVCQTLQHGETRVRSRSESRLSRASSRTSMRSLWESSTMPPMHRQEVLPGKFDSVGSVNDGDSDEEVMTENVTDWLNKGRTLSGLRRRSTVETHPVNETEQGPASPGATMAAIREQFAAQLQQFQHSMALHLQNLPQFQMPNMPQIPNLPNLPPMPVLPNYQAYIQSAPMMQRISSLVPNMRTQRPDSPQDPASNTSENKWGVLQFFGNKESPPAYEDIFPQKGLDIKQSSAAQAAADFEANTKCASLFDQEQGQDQDVAESSQSQEVPAVLQIGRKHLITKEQQETLQRAHAQRLKAGSSDKMLWFVWIPILVLVLGAMLWSGAPTLVSSTTSAIKTLGGLITNPRDISNRVRNIVQELV